MTFEQMLLSTDFFSFDAFKEQNQQVLGLKKKVQKMSSYKKLATNYNLKSYFDYDLEVQSDNLPVTKTQMDKCKTDEESKKVMVDLTAPA